MCKLIRFIYLIIPLPGFRAFLIKRHIGACPKCQKEWEVNHDIQEFFTRPEWIEQEQSLWPQIQGKILTSGREESMIMREKKPFLLLRWQWAVAGLGLLILVGISFLLRNEGMFGPAKPEDSSALMYPPVHIVHAEISGKKAVPFIYQTSENLFIWFDEAHQEED